MLSLRASKYKCLFMHTILEGCHVLFDDDGNRNRNIEKESNFTEQYNNNIE